MNLKQIRITDFHLNLFYVAISLIVLLGCETDDPVREDVPELITQVTLTFTPVSGGDPVVATATDPDGDGIQGIQTDGPITLKSTERYSLEIALINSLAQPADPEYNVTEEVQEEAEEHIFFFSWTENLFSSPAGNGNIDNRSDPMNYADEDANGLPLGLETSWTAAGAAAGDFRVVLKHQPDVKSGTSDSGTGETDVDITFEINIQ